MRKQGSTQRAYASRRKVIVVEGEVVCGEALVMPDVIDGG